MADYLTRADLQDELDKRGYVTRIELREELQLRDHRFEAIDQRFEAIDRRFEAIDRRFEAIDRRFDDFEQRMIQSMGQIAVVIGEEVGRQVRAAEERTRVEIAHQIRGSEERLLAHMSALVEPYRDLPARVATLEDHVGIKR